MQDPRLRFWYIEKRRGKVVWFFYFLCWSRNTREVAAVPKGGSRCLSHSLSLSLSHTLSLPLPVYLMLGWKERGEQYEQEEEVTE